MTPLHGHKVLLGVSGGIASYKSASLARRLSEAGADVRAVMTTGAQAFVTPLTLQAVTGRPVHTDLLDPAAEAAMGHIELARWADAILIAPASANILARLAAGLADDLLSTLCLASDAPLLVAPAMNRLMWAHAATRENVARLAARGVGVLGPDEGEQACGETGAGRMLEPEALRDALIEHVAARGTSGEDARVEANEAATSVETATGGMTGAIGGAETIGGAAASAPMPAIDAPAADSPSTAHATVSLESRRGSPKPTRPDDPLAGLAVLVTAGPTVEPIDPVRYLSNRSSGRMGYAIAAAAAARGARVTLVSGPVALETPAGVERVDVTSAGEMHAAVLEATATADLFVAVAAVADYRLAEVAAEKIKKTGETLSLELVRNPDILADVAALGDATRPFCVGFAAETERLEAHAREKLERKRLDMIAANRVAQPGAEVFGSDTNALEVYWPPAGHASVARGAKDEVARALLDLVAERLVTRGAPRPASARSR